MVCVFSIHIYICSPLLNFESIFHYQHIFLLIAILEKISFKLINSSTFPDETNRNKLRYLNFDHFLFNFRTTVSCFFQLKRSCDSSVVVRWTTRNSEAIWWKNFNTVLINHEKCHWETDLSRAINNLKTVNEITRHQEIREEDLKNSRNKFTWSSWYFL